MACLKFLHVQQLQKLANHQLKTYYKYLEVVVWVKNCNVVLHVLFNQVRQHMVKFGGLEPGGLDCFGIPENERDCCEKGHP